VIFNVKMADDNSNTSDYSYIDDVTDIDPDGSKSPESWWWTDHLPELVWTGILMFLFLVSLVANLVRKLSENSNHWGAIQIICDTLVGGGVRDSVTKCYKGEGGVSQSVTWHFFKNFKPYFCILTCAFGGKRLFFGKLKCHVTPGGGVGVRSSFTKWHMEEFRVAWGLKYSQKKCHELFE